MQDEKGDRSAKVGCSPHWDSFLRHTTDFEARGHESVSALKRVNALFSEANGEKGCFGSLYQFPEMSLLYKVLQSTMLPNTIYCYSDDSEDPLGSRHFPLQLCGGAIPQPCLVMSQNNQKKCPSLLYCSNLSQSFTRLECIVYLTDKGLSRYVGHVKECKQ